MVAISDGAKDIRTMLMAVFDVLIVIILAWYHLCVREFMSMIARNQPEKAEHLAFLLYHLWHGQTQEVLDYLNTKVKAKNDSTRQKLIGSREKHQEEIIDDDQRKKAGKKVGLEPEKNEDVDGIDNQWSSNGEAAKKTSGECVEEAYEDVIKRYRKPKKARLNQQGEDFDVQNQSSSTGKAVKKVVGSGRVEKACDSVIGKRQKRKAMSWSQVGSRRLAILKVVELNHKWDNIWFPPIASNDLQPAANDPCCTSELDLVA